MTPESRAFRYRAFISYSHKDKGWGERLHKALERYAIPKRLRNTKGRDGPIADRIFPVFRDREELPSSADLHQQIKIALDESACLIVICSPFAARSRWVNEEILAFKRLGRADRIFALIIDGEPNASDAAAGGASRECFPDALKFSVDAEGSPTSVRVEPVAADARAEGDGVENATLKVIAGVLGIGFDELKQRDLEAQQHRLRRLVAISGGVAVGFAFLLALALYYASEARTQRSQALLHLADSYAAHARDLAADGSYDLAARLAITALRISGSVSHLAGDVLRFAMPQMAVRARMTVNIQPGSTAGFSADGELIASPNGNDVDVRETKTAALLHTLRGHTQAVTTAEFAPDGKQILTAAEDGTARLWNAATGAPTAVLKDGASRVSGARFWRHGAAIVTASFDGHVIVWDVATRTQSAVLDVRGQMSSLIVGASPRDQSFMDVGGGVMGLDVSTDGRKILALSRMFVPFLFVFDADGNIAEKTVNCMGCRDVRFSPDSRLFATASLTDGLALRDAATGQLVRTLAGKEGVDWSVRFSQDGTRVVTASNSGDTRVWDVATGQLLFTLKGRAAAAKLAAFSNDGTFVAAGRDDGTIDVWSVAGERLLATLSGHVQAINALVFSRDDATLYSGSWDGTVRVSAWQTRYPRQVKVVSVSGDDVFVEAGARVAVLGHDTSLTTIDLTTLEVKTQEVLSGGIGFTSVSHDGTRLFIAGPQGAIVRDLDKSTSRSLPSSDAVTAASWSPDNHRILGVTADGSVIDWNAMTGAIAARIAPDATTDSANSPPSVGIHDASARSSRDGSTLVILNAKGQLDAWTAAGAHLLRFGADTDRVATFDVSPATDEVVTGGFDTEVRIWDLGTGARTHDLVGHTRGLMGAALERVRFSDDGAFVLSGSGDGTWRLWSARSGQELRSYGNGQSQELRSCMDFLPGSTEVVRAGEDGNGHVFSIATGQELLTIPSVPDASLWMYGCPRFSINRSVAVVRHATEVVLWSADRLGATPSDLLSSACNTAGGDLAKSVRTFTRAEADRDSVIHDLHLDASGAEVDVCTGIAVVARAEGASAAGTAAVPAFSQPDASLKALTDTWSSQLDAADKLATANKEQEAFDQFSKAVETARTIRKGYGATPESRRKLLVSLVMTGAVAVDLDRNDVGKTYMTEAKALLAVAEQLGEADQRMAALKATIEQVLRRIGTR
jgi:WD40 repeat protein